MRFDRQPSDRQTGRRKPPRNYLAASSQLRLLTMVGMLMLVLYLMKEARKPERWAWMWGGQRPAAIENPEGDTYQVLIPEQAKKLLDKDPRVRRDAWAHILPLLQPVERTALDRILLASRGRLSLQKGDLSAGRTAVQKLTQSWDEFLLAARSSLDESVPPAQLEHWTAELAATEVEWKEKSLPALRTPLEGRAWTSEQRDVLLELQAVLDEIALDAIRDDTVWRAEERAAWSRLVEQLRTRGAAELRRDSRDHVGYAALLRQSDAYRAKLVTVRGTVRLAYQSPAPPNDLGVRYHYVMWLRPQAGPDMPLVVYTLDLPAGFPQVKPKDERGQGTSLNEEVEVTGYFFKRWVYAAQDDIRSVPLILAASPRWLDRPSPAAEGESPSQRTVAAWLIGVVMASLGLVLWAYRATRMGKRHASEPLQIAPPLSETAPGTAENLPP